MHLWFSDKHIINLSGTHRVLLYTTWEIHDQTLLPFMLKYNVELSNNFSTRGKGIYHATPLPPKCMCELHWVNNMWERVKHSVLHSYSLDLIWGQRVSKT